MFDRLSESFSGLYRKLSGKGAISESNVRDAMADVRRALVEADAHASVVEDFCGKVLEDALGREVTKTLKPGEEMIGIVYDRLIEFLGGTPQKPGEPIPNPLAATDGIMKMTPGPTIVMMCGLQGSGKTTTCGKLAAYLKKRGRSVMLAAADLQRPAAVEQLQTVAHQVRDTMPGSAQVLFYSEPDKIAEYGQAVGVAVGVCQRALAEARKQGVDTLILDTAGRLHVNDELMGELVAVNKLLGPHQIFLVVDAMTGQDAVNSAKAFHARLEVDGVIMTKFDSDTRGGAALSVKHVTGAPIKFVGVGEKLEALEDFHPQRFATRMLGMGDVLSLVEKARETVSDEEAEKLQEKLAKGEMSMEDFLDQLRKLRKMGPLKQLLGLLPGVGGMLKDVNIDDKQLDRVEAIINSMTKKERVDVSLLNNSRRMRIAKGSGTSVDEVGKLVKQFEAVSKMTKTMASMSAFDKVKAMKQLGAGAGLTPGMGIPGLSGKGSTASTFKDRFKKRR